MKKFFAVLLCCIFMMGFACTMANAEGEKATFTMEGYEVGARIGDLQIAADVNWLDIVGYEVVDTETGERLDRNIEFKHGKEYFLMLFAATNATVVVDDEASSFELSNGYSQKTANLTGENGEVIMIGFMLIPHAIPATGDGANIMMWTALLACSVIGMIIVARKAKRSY